MNAKILFAVSGFFLLLIGCAIPHQMHEEEAVEEPFYVEEEPFYENNMEEQKAQPVVIQGGRANKELYAGLPNSIKIHVEGESTEHLHVFSSNGRLTPADVSKGMYNFYEQRPGFVVEIVAKDTFSGKTITKVFDVVAIPAPEAYIWKYRTAVKIHNLVFNAKDFSTQNAVVLHHRQQVPALCLAESFTLVRIDGEGKRTVHHNKDKNGLFDETAKKIISAAQKGDIYLVQDIKTSCSPFPVKNIVYTIK